MLDKLLGMWYNVLTMVNKDKRIAFRIDRETYEKAKAKADYEGRPLSVILRAAMEAYVREGISYEDLRDLGKEPATAQTTTLPDDDFPVARTITTGTSTIKAWDEE